MMDVAIARAVFSDVGDLTYCKRRGWILSQQGRVVAELGPKKLMLEAAVSHASQRSSSSREMELRLRLADQNVTISDLLAERDRGYAKPPDSPPRSLEAAHLRSEVARLKATLAELRAFAVRSPQIPNTHRTCPRSPSPPPT